MRDWSSDVCSSDLTGFDDTAFKPLLKSFVAVADRFAHKYRSFTLNPMKK